MSGFFELLGEHLDKDSGHLGLALFNTYSKDPIKDLTQWTGEQLNRSKQELEGMVLSRGPGLTVSFLIVILWRARSGTSRTFVVALSTMHQSPPHCLTPFPHPGWRVFHPVPIALAPAVAHLWNLGSRSMPPPHLSPSSLPNPFFSEEG